MTHAQRRESQDKSGLVPYLNFVFYNTVVVLDVRYADKHQLLEVALNVNFALISSKNNKNNDSHSFSFILIHSHSHEYLHFQCNFKKEKHDMDNLMDYLCQLKQIMAVYITTQRSDLCKDLCSGELLLLSFPM